MNIWLILMLVFAVIALWTPWWGETYVNYRLGPFLLSWLFFAIFMVQKNGGINWH